MCAKIRGQFWVPQIRYIFAWALPCKIKLINLTNEIEPLTTKCLRWNDVSSMHMFCGECEPESEYRVLPARNSDCTEFLIIRNWGSRHSVKVRIPCVYRYSVIHCTDRPGIIPRLWRCERRKNSSDHAELSTIPVWIFNVHGFSIDWYSQKFNILTEF